MTRSGLPVYRQPALSVYSPVAYPHGRQTGTGGSPALLLSSSCSRFRGSPASLFSCSVFRCVRCVHCFSALLLSCPRYSPSLLLPCSAASLLRCFPAPLFRCSAVLLLRPAQKAAGPAFCRTPPKPDALPHPSVKLYIAHTADYRRFIGSGNRNMTVLAVPGVFGLVLLPICTKRIIRTDKRI